MTVLRRGSPFRLIRDELNRRHIAEADNNWRLYKQPLGRRLAIVKRECNDEEIVVTSPGYTFSPGSVVATGSHTGIGGEFILSPPPPGRLGGGVYPQVAPVPGVFLAAQILSADPDEIEPGETLLAVDLVAVGLLETDELAAVVWSESEGVYVADPYVTLANFSYISATAATVDVTASESAPVGHLLRFEVVR